MATQEPRLKAPGGAARGATLVAGVLLLVGNALCSAGGLGSQVPGASGWPLLLIAGALALGIALAAAAYASLAALITIPGARPSWRPRALGLVVAGLALNAAGVLMLLDAWGPMEGAAGPYVLGALWLGAGALGARAAWRARRDRVPDLPPRRQGQS